MTGSYQTWIVILSVVVAIAASHAALSLAQRVSRSAGVSANLWLAGGAISMGVGIWSMHFIGMMAFNLPIRLAYDVATTAVSFLIAVGASGYALSVAHEASISAGRLLRSAFILGLGIASMHYVGMLAITVQPGLDYDPLLFILSVAIAMGSSWVALRLFFQLRKVRGVRRHLLRAMSAVVMGLAIAGMHYTGMAATGFAPGAWCSGGVQLQQEWLAVLIAVVALGLLAITALLMLVDSHLAARARRHSEELLVVNRRLQHAATHDALTGLPNRTLLMDRLSQAISAGQRQRKGFAVVAFDLDRFKAINDSLGHSAGDDLLKQVSKRIVDTLRASDTLARMGGDEFVAILGGAGSRADVETVLAKTQHAIRAPLLVGGVEVVVGSSIGVSFFPADAADPAELLKQADMAMYHAKRQGRDNLQFFVPDLEAEDRDRLELESDLRRAIANDEMRVYYQPQVDVVSGRVRGAEALLRWNHPVRGIVSPDAFIPLAEETGLIVPLGEWVLREACSQLRRWHDRGFAHLNMAVNLSAEQLRHPGLVQTVTSAIRSAGIPASCLELELTESAVMHDTDHSVSLLGELVRLGVRISVDDFGTGHSSLSYLRSLPLHALKIDRSFIRDIENSSHSAEIVRAIVSLAHSLNLEVVAEGVETPSQRDFVRALGCAQFQGYLSSRPVPADEFVQSLRIATGATSTRLRAPAAALGKLLAAGQ